jgi:hypothetical protein
MHILDIFVHLECCKFQLDSYRLELELYFQHKGYSFRHYHYSFRIGIHKEDIIYQVFQIRSKHMDILVGNLLFPLHKQYSLGR